RALLWVNPFCRGFFITELANAIALGRGRAVSSRDGSACAWNRCRRPTSWNAHFCIQCPEWSIASPESPKPHCFRKYRLRHILTRRRSPVVGKTGAIVVPRLRLFRHRGLRAALRPSHGECRE